MLFLGIDVGGTKIEACAVELGRKVAAGSFCEPNTLKVQFRERTTTNRHAGAPAILDKIENLIVTACAASATPINRFDGIGISLPGPVDPTNEILTNSNTKALTGLAISHELRRRLDYRKPVVSANDANCFAVAESTVAEGLEPGQFSLGIILGSGVGGGICYDRRMIPGKRGGAGEFGHTTLVSGGHACHCGRYGCAEQYLSGPGLEAAFACRTYSQIEGRPGAREIFELAENGDPHAIAVVGSYCDQLAEFLTGLTNTFEPQLIVLGGGMSNQKRIYDGLEDRIQAAGYTGEKTTSVRQHVLGDSAGVFGAVLLAHWSN